MALHWVYTGGASSIPARDLANVVTLGSIIHVVTGITATEVHRRLPWRHHRRDDPRERAILARGELPPARARRVEWLDLRGHDLPLLPLHRGCLAHALDRVTRGTRGGPRPSPRARPAKVAADLRVRRSDRLLARPLPRVPFRWLPGSSPAHGRPAEDRRLLPRGLPHLPVDRAAWRDRRDHRPQSAVSRPPLLLPGARVRPRLTGRELQLPRLPRRDRARRLQVEQHGLRPRRSGSHPPRHHLGPVRRAGGTASC